jgi:hypothetical protein
MQGDSSQREQESASPAKTVAERVAEKIGIDAITGELIDADATEEGGE